LADFKKAASKEKTPEELLIDDILSTSAFKKASLRSKLLSYLSDHRERYVPSDEIMTQVFGLTEAHLKSEERVRERTKDLRDALEEFDLVTDLPQVCTLPNATQGEGYKLRFDPRDPLSPAKVFWRAHLGKYPPILVYTEPMFFYDIVTGGYMRFLDVNPESIGETAITELDARHGAELRKQYGSSLEERLRPTRIYVGLGEVAALDILGVWFSQKAFIHVAKEASDRIAVLRGSPILLGGSRTNKLIDSYLNCEEGRHFGYRLHETKFKFVSIANATEAEKSSLAKFSITQEGEYTHAGNMATLSQVRDRLVIVHRMLVPGSKRTVTMISSEATLGIRQVACALTEKDQVAPIVKALANGDGSLPNSFELLFSVRIAPGNMEHEAGDAEFIAYRKY